MTRDYPETIGESVRLFMNLLEPEKLASLRKLSEERLIDEHAGIGVFIRNAFGLWRNNPRLLNNAGGTHPDDASLIILKALWQALRNTDPDRRH